MRGNTKAARGDQRIRFDSGPPEHCFKATQKVICSKILEADGLAKRFGSNIAVDDLSFSVSQGTIHGLLGPNGSGKTTTIKMSVGLLRQDRGSITAFGETLDDSRKLKSKIGYMPEIPSYPGYLTAAELLETYAGLFELGGNERDAHVREILRAVGLVEYAGNRIGTYTKGMKQRLGLAQALIGDPEMLVLDEPSVGLDPLGMVRFRELMKNLARKGKTILLSSHLLGEVEKLCNDITILSHGKAVASGAVEELMRTMEHESQLEIELSEVKDETMKALKSLPFVEELRSEGRRVTLRLSTSEDVRPEVSRALVSCGGIILSMKEVGATMEDMFVHYVTKDKSAIILNSSVARSPSSATFSEASTLSTMVHIIGEVVTGKDVRYELDIVNVGPKSVWFTEIKELVPSEVRVKDAPAEFDFDQRSIRVEGLTLDPLETKTVRLILQPIKVGILSLSPRIHYLDEFGEARVHLADSHSVFVTTPEAFDFRAEESRNVFDYLIYEFMEDSLNKKLSLETSGWRSLVQAAEGAQVSTSSLYGKARRYGPALSELLSKGIVEARTFPKQRGRGGEAVKVRIRYELEPVKKYLNEMVTKKSEKGRKTPI